MKNHRMLALGFALVAAAGCTAFKSKPASQLSTKDVNIATRWHATLSTPSTLAGALQIAGSATMAPGNGANTTVALVYLTNATPGGVHPWAIHRGQCGNDGGVLGALNDYPAIQVGKDGHSSTSANVPVSTPTEGSFYVTVQASAANAETVIACGNLAPPTP